MEKVTGEILNINNEYGTYEEYKAAVDTELQRSAESFVRIGYLLKVARDTDILRESGYENVNDFAKAEYGIDKTQVSRFIHINDRFSENGYSDQLKMQYQGFGYAKLAIMLQLPDAINEEITPNFSKSEVQAIKEEVDAEKEISDLEVLMEETDQKQEEYGLFAKVLHQLGRDNPELYLKLYDAVENTVYDGTSAPIVDKLVDSLAPAGEAILSVRIQGEGRKMLSIKGKETRPTVTDIRTNEKRDCSWDDFIIDMEALCEDEDAKKSWEKLYGERFPVKEEPKPKEVAPVQPKSAPKKEPKVVKAKAKKKEETKKEPVVEQATLHDISKEIPKPQEAEDTKLPIEEESTEEKETTEDEQVEGQTNIESDFPEYMPETTDRTVDASELEKCWEDADLMMDRVKAFFDENEAKSIFTLSLEDLKMAYQDTINLAAALEKIINGKKYLTE